MTIRASSLSSDRIAAPARKHLAIAPLASAVLLALFSLSSKSHAQLRGDFFTQQNAALQQQQRAAHQATRAAQQAQNMQQQQAAARAQLSQSLDNLNRTANAIAAQQAAQNAARLAAQQQASAVADGLAQGGLEVATGDKAKWVGANAAQESTNNGQHHVSIEQTESKAILNWNRFDVGRNTTVEFQQKNTDAVLNRVVGDQIAPSQIQGKIKGAGTVMVVNQNGIVFSGTSQVNVRNLVAAAATITDHQFLEHGLYGMNDGAQATFSHAQGQLIVEAGARLNTHAPESSTQDGGYVLLLGQHVHNQGDIYTPKGQTVLAAGDNFYIRKGVGTEANIQSSTAGNEVSTSRVANSLAGTVSNTGLIFAPEGDISLTGHQISQAGVVLATSSQSKRGTVHLSTRASDTDSHISVSGTTAILLAERTATALDSQRDAALERLASQARPNSGGVFDNLSTILDRRDLSRIEIVSGNTVEFASNSISLATGGEIAISAVQRTLLRPHAILDVSGAVGVPIAMAANNLTINVQGNEQRDSPNNRDSKNLNNQDLYLDRRLLIIVPDGTQGYEGDRWYTQGGLLEVGGYVSTAGHTMGEWAAQGGTLTISGGDFVSQAGSSINLSGGTLDVHSGYLRQSWLRGDDGRLYQADTAPGDRLYQPGVFIGYVHESSRWGGKRTFQSPLLAPQQRYEQGYTVGRDAGKLVLATPNAVLHGDIISHIYQGPQQHQKPQSLLDGYYQSQFALARGAQLILGSYTPVYDINAKILRHVLGAQAKEIHIGAGPEHSENTGTPSPNAGHIWLNSASLEQFHGLHLAAQEHIRLEQALSLQAGAHLTLYSPIVQINADITAPSGTLKIGNVLSQYSANTNELENTYLNAPAGVEPSITVAQGVTLDTSGLLFRINASNTQDSAYIQGGDIALRSTGHLSLEQDSLLNTSAGAAVALDQSVKGGKGGNITLGSGLLGQLSTAVLSLNGRIQGYGYTGSGTLNIESASAITIDGEEISQNGVFQAGKSSQLGLVLLADYQVKRGDILPIDYIHTSNITLPGDMVSSGLARDAIVTLEADWVPPYDILFEGYSDRDSISINASGLTWDGEVFSRISIHKGYISAYSHAQQKDVVLPYIPKGTRANLNLRNLHTRRWVGYVVEPHVFPHGIPTIPVNTKYFAGSVSPTDLLVPRGTVISAATPLSHDAHVAATTSISQALFHSGFSHYQVRAHHGLVLPQHTELHITQPQLQLQNPRSKHLDSQVLIELPPLYTHKAATLQVQQRLGASISLAAGMRDDEAKDLGLGNLIIEAGSLIQVDPGQSIQLQARANLSVAGQLRAPSGNITLLGAQSHIVGRPVDHGGLVADHQAHQRSIYLGPQAVLDASAHQYTAYDPYGRAYGILHQGGRIIIGGALDESRSRALASDAFIYIDAGALLDISGGSAYLHYQGQNHQHHSAAGEISLASANGIYLYGHINAHAASPQALGGKLSLALEAPNYSNTNNSPTDSAVLRLRELIVQQAALAPHHGELHYGHAALSADTLNQTGLASLTLYSNGTISFAPNVNLQLGRELRLYAGSYTHSGAADIANTIRLQAPYLLMAGIVDNAASADYYARPSYQGGLGAHSSLSHLSLHGQLIDIKGMVNFGVNQSVNSLAVERPDFAQLSLISDSDIRFIYSAPLFSGRDFGTELVSAGNITLQAQRLYPTTAVKGRIIAGRILKDGYEALRTGSQLLITPSTSSPLHGITPESVFGELGLYADEINQYAAVYAPMGKLLIGGNRHLPNYLARLVTLGSGSNSSVSAAGLTLPYGQTLDDILYTYLGQEIAPEGLGQNSSHIELRATSIQVQENAIIDLSGGGDLQGAGFVPGRGGSVDLRYTPLMQYGKQGFSLPLGHTVYAIIPGYQTPYAALDKQAKQQPALGQQITLADKHIPGLPAGTYTLLPASYALLPGAYRVELHSAALAGAAPTQTMRNGSYASHGYLGLHNSSVVNTLATPLTITAAHTLRRYAQYNETSYNDFIISQAEKLGAARAQISADAKTLKITLLQRPEQPAQLSFQGQARMQAAQYGYGGTAEVQSPGTRLEILADHATAAGGHYTAVYARDLNAIGASQLLIGGEHWFGANFNPNQIDTRTQTPEIILRSGAHLQGPQIMLVSQADGDGITVESGASINTLGQGQPAYDARQGYVYSTDNTMLALSNGHIITIAPTSNTPRPANIHIGACTQFCGQAAELYSEGSLLLATQGDVIWGPATRFGTRNLVLSVASMNLGNAASLAQLAATGQLNRGMQLDQAALNRLLASDTAYGAPALESLVLNAGESLNFFGTVQLDTRDSATGHSSLKKLVLSSPAIYGYGTHDDSATLITDHLLWVGTANPAPAAINGGRGTGHGKLMIQAERITFGYDHYAQPSGLDNHTRHILGFKDIHLHANDRISANHKGALRVYHQHDVHATDPGTAYQGGNLTLITPLLTAAGAAVFQAHIGGHLLVQAPPTGALSTFSPYLKNAIETGGELQLHAHSMQVNSSIALPSGRLSLSTVQDLLLSDLAQIDLAGREISLHDISRYSWGGELSLHSQRGHIHQTTGSIIDVSAQYNHAGSLSASALGEQGQVSLQGQLLGNSTGEYDAGGTWVPYRRGEFSLRAYHLGQAELSSDFAQLNRRLNQGQFFGARHFQLKQGDLSIANELQAQHISVSLDHGQLTVIGKIDASGAQVGSIRLAAQHGIQLGSQSLLDAHGHLLRVDSYGQIIDAPNRAAIVLNSGLGQLYIAGGAAFDLRHGTDHPDLLRPALGTLDLYAPRLDAAAQTATAAAATYGDIAIHSAQPVSIQGAKRIAVYAQQGYNDAPYGTEPAASGQPYQVVDQAYLDSKHSQAQQFMQAALHNASLLNTKLAGLRSYTDSFHLRPAIELRSSGDMIVRGDLDLSGYRYASLNPNTPKTSLYGSGEPGQLSLRAAGDLSIYGSINDGFAPPPETPDDEGWILTPGVQALAGDVLIPIAGVTLKEGTKYLKNRTLNYAVRAKDLSLPAGIHLPTDIKLEQTLTLPAGTVLAADILKTDGSVLLAAGTLVGAEGLTVAIGSTLKAGMLLPTAIKLSELLWPAHTPLPADLIQKGDLTLPLGAIIAQGTDIKLDAEQFFIDLRPKNAQGKPIARKNWAIAAMLPAGSLSWGLDLVAGADLDSDVSQVVQASKHHLSLADTHYSSAKEYKVSGRKALVWLPDNPWDQPAGEEVTNPTYLQFCLMFSACVEKIIPEGDPKLIAVRPVSPIFSVLRTGTGDLSLQSSGHIHQLSAYGIYTAGTQTPLARPDMDAAFNQPRGRVTNNSVLGKALDNAADYEALVNGGSNSLYQAWYPSQGGNVSIRAAGDITGHIWGGLNNSNQTLVDNAQTANWLWRQGTGTNNNDIAYTPTAWWLNFGTYINSLGPRNAYHPTISGFTGLGTLGGGNVQVYTGGAAGLSKLSFGSNITPHHSNALQIAIGSTGRVLPNGTLVQTGGGDIDLRLQQGWNSHAYTLLSPNHAVRISHQLLGTITNTRGNLHLLASQIGTLAQGYNRWQDPKDIRPADPFSSTRVSAHGGLQLVLGDSPATLLSRGNLVLSGVSNPGLAHSYNSVPYTSRLGSGEHSQTWFSLWTDNTAINAQAAGGHVAFDTRPFEYTAPPNWEFNTNNGWLLLPGNVGIQSYTANIYYGYSTSFSQPTTIQGSLLAQGGALLAPLGQRSIHMLAAQSIYGGGYSINISASDQSNQAQVFKPGFVGYTNNQQMLVTNAFNSAPIGDNPLFAFGLNTLGTDSLSIAPTSSFYAVKGDIIGLHIGSMLESLVFFNLGDMHIYAGRDLVSSGHRLTDELTWVSGITKAPSRPKNNLIVHTHDNQVSTIQAGRDILYANFHIAGPGTLEVSAGRNIIQDDQAQLRSLGPIAPGDHRPGASIVVQAGIGPDTQWDAFLQHYLDPANAALVGKPLADQAGKVVKTYHDELITWLEQRYGFVADEDADALAQARAYFATLGREQQRIFARHVYFAELRAGGREYNDTSSPRVGSYLRGRRAIDALFPTSNAQGQPIVYEGDLLMYGGSGIHTDLGGDIQVLTPGGAQTYGVEGAAPPSTAGLITRGQGDIQLYSLNSILLGQSRIMTTFGGDILAWSAQGDINAGRGSKTTVVYTPPRRVYDSVGNVSINPDVPSTGAGIATLNPIPEIPAGDVDLIAPLGTIDAGEAGIRVSGNVNLAALHVVNADNIQVQGESKGIPIAVTVNVGALTSASSAASSAATAAQETLSRARDAARSNQPSQIQVQILGFGAASSSSATPTNTATLAPTHYDYQQALQIVGLGQALTPASHALSDSERQAIINALP